MDDRIKQIIETKRKCPDILKPLYECPSEYGLRDAVNCTDGENSCLTCWEMAIEEVKIE